MMMLLDFIICRKWRVLVPVVYRRSRTEVWPRSIWLGLKLLAFLQNAKYPWVIHPILGVLIVETFVQECCNGYGHEKFYAGTIKTSDCLIPACEQFDLQRSSSLSTPYRRLFNICATGINILGFGVLWEPMGFTNAKNQGAWQSYVGKMLRFQHHVSDYQTAGEELEYYGLVTR